MGAWTRRASSWAAACAGEMRRTRWRTDTACPRTALPSPARGLTARTGPLGSARLAIHGRRIRAGDGRRILLRRAVAAARGLDAGEEVALEAEVRVPLSMVNRHGLVAGATGTGKTKTLQILAGQLSGAGVPVFSDVKGDLTGISQPGDATAQPIVDRAAQLGIDVHEPASTSDRAASLSGARRPGTRHDLVVRSDPARQGARPEQDAGVGADAAVRLLRRPAPAAARPRRPPDDAEVPVVGRGQAALEECGGEGDGRGVAALDRRAGSDRRRRVLR